MDGSAVRLGRGIVTAEDHIIFSIFRRKQIGKKKTLKKSRTSVRSMRNDFLEGQEQKLLGVRACCMVRTRGSRQFSLMAFDSVQGCSDLSW